jgi:hypothetical protein
MKTLKYTLHTANASYEVTLPWSEVNEKVAKRESHNGEYEIFDDGTPDPVEQPTQLDRVEAQITYTAMMTDTLLEV